MRLTAEIFDVIGNGYFRNRLVVDVEDAVLHLNPIAGQPDQPLDVIGRIVAGEFEHHDVAARGGRSHEAARERHDAERERIAAVAIGGLGDEEVIAASSVPSMEPEGMLKGWNTKERITPAISSA